MVEINPNSSNHVMDMAPRLVFDSDTSPEAQESLEKFAVEVQGNPTEYEAALAFYSAHPVAAEAIVKLTVERPNVIMAVSRVYEVFSNKFDLETGFDDDTENALASDPMHKRHLELMNSRRGEEAQHEKTKMRIGRVKKFIQRHNTSDTGSGSNPAA